MEMLIYLTVFALGCLISYAAVSAVTVVLMMLSGVLDRRSADASAGREPVPLERRTQSLAGTA